MQKAEAGTDLDRHLKAMQDILNGSGLDNRNLPLALFALKFLAQEWNARHVGHRSNLPVEEMADLKSVENLARMFEDTLRWDDRPLTNYLLSDLSRVRGETEVALLSHVEDAILPNQCASWLLERTYHLDLPFGSNNTPRELALMMAALPQIDGPVSVFDPSCGIGNLLIAALEAFGPYSTFVGHEASASARSWTKVRLAIDGYWDADIDVPESGNARLASGSHERRFEVVITNPPFGIQFRQDDIRRIFHDTSLVSHSKTGRMSSELVYLLIAHRRLAQNGVAAVLVPLGVLFRTGTDSSVRKFLLEESVIDAVIALPGRLSAPATAIGTAIIILRQNPCGKKDGRTLFIDARQLGVRQGQKTILDEATIGKILDVYRQRTVEVGFSALVSQSHIATHEWSLDPGRYIEQPAAVPADVSARRDKINAFEQHYQQLLGEYEALIERLTSDARRRR